MAKGIQSVDIAYGVLEVLQRAGRPLSLKDVAASVGMSSSKARMYLVSLLRTGLVSQNGEAGSYTLGPAALSLGLAAFNQIDLIDSARSLMASLTKETQAPTLLSMWSGSSVTIVARNDSIEDLPIDFRVGGTVSLSKTATGRVFLAYLPATQTQPFLLRELQRSANGQPMPVDTQSLEARIQLIRERGYDCAEEVMLASDPAIRLSGYGAIAAPVVDVFQELRFVITVLHRTSTEPQQDVVENILTRIRKYLPTPRVQPPVGEPKSAKTASNARPELAP